MGTESTKGHGNYDLCVNHQCFPGIPLGTERYQVHTPPGGLHNALIGMLSANNLSDYVFVNTGTRYPPLPYGSGFIDASHQYAEIIANMEPWIQMVRLRNGAPAIYMFHDMGGLPACKRMFHQILISNMKFR